MIGWLRRLLGAGRFDAPTYDQLMAEFSSGSRRVLRGDEIQRALEAEARRMPPGTRLPSPGEVYEAVDDVEISYLTTHAPPYTGGGKRVLAKGERVRISTVGKHRMSVYCDPLRYEALHAHFISKEERANPSYTGYYLFVRTAQLNTKFRLVEGSGGGAARA